MAVAGVLGSRSGRSARHGVAGMAVAGMLGTAVAGMAVAGMAVAGMLGTAVTGMAVAGMAGVHGTEWTDRLSGSRSPRLHRQAPHQPTVAVAFCIGIAAVGRDSPGPRKFAKFSSMNTGPQDESNPGAPPARRNGRNTPVSQQIFSAGAARYIYAARCEGEAVLCVHR